VWNYTLWHYLTTFKAVDVLVMREEKCHKVILRGL